MFTGGHPGRYLRIALRTGTAQWRPLPESVLRRFLGGGGLGTWLLYREGPANVDPLAPEIETEDRAALIDSLVLCKFLRGVFADLFAVSADMLRAVTGWDVTAGELRRTARRIVTAKKLDNQREGWTAAEDTLPRRFLREGLPAGTNGEATLPRERLSALIAAYYAARGWDRDGGVPARCVEDLDLQDLTSPAFVAGPGHPPV